MRLRAVDAQTVQVRALELDVPFAAGEEMRTEVSAKFTREQVVDELADAGHAARRVVDRPRRRLRALLLAARRTSG